MKILPSRYPDNPIRFYLGIVWTKDSDPSILQYWTSIRLDPFRVDDYTCVDDDFDFTASADLDSSSQKY